MPSQPAIATVYAGANDERPFESARAAENRAIRRTTALSLALHALLLSLGISSLQPSASVGSVPTLQLTLELNEDGYDQEKDNAPRTERVITFGRSQPVPSPAIADNRPTEISPASDTGKSDPPPPRPTAGATDEVPHETAVADAAQAGWADIITTTGESERAEPASGETAEAVVATATIPSEQQQVMARKILRWARSLGDAEETPSQLSWKQDGREYTAVLQRRPAASDTDIESAIVEIATVENGQALRTRMNLKRLAFSHFTQLVDEWDSNIQFHDDEVVGRFHSNSEIALGYERAIAPRFHGKVTTAAGGFRIASWSRLAPRTEVFPAGFESRAGRIILPRRFMKAVNSNAALANARRHAFKRDTRINFYSDGTYGWQSLDGNSREERAPLGQGPVLLIAERRTELRVRGTVNGNVLVYSPQRIWVDGNLIYAQNPRLTPDAQDYLGLASDNVIAIAHPEITGPGDLEINGAIYARDGFNVTAEYEPGLATLYIFGSLTAGTLSATEPRYATRVEFDPRFEHTRPPGFPMTNRYEVEQWDGQWRADDDAPE